MRCHAVISGRVKRRRRRYTVVVTVHSGTGKLLGRREASGRGARRLPRVGAALGRACRRLLRRARYRRRGRGAVARRRRRRRRRRSPPPEPQPPPAEQPAPDGGERGGDFGYEPPPKAGAAQPSAPAGKGEPDEQLALAADLDAEGDAGEPAVKKQAKSPSKLEGVFDLGVAVGLSTRSYELNAARPQDQRKYDGGLFPEFTIRAAVYPAAFATRSFWRNLGVALSYTHHISISTKLPENPNNKTCGFGGDIDSASQQLLVDAVLRWAFLDSWGETSPVLLGSAGFGLREFSLDRNNVLSTFSYKFMRFGAGLRFPLGTPLIALKAGFDLRPVFAVGQDAVDAFGAAQGGFGWAIRAGGYGEKNLSFGRIFYFATFEYQSFSTDFAGLDPKTHPAQSCTPQLNVATQGSDRYIRLWLGAGYAI